MIPTNPCEWITVKTDAELHRAKARKCDLAFYGVHVEIIDHRHLAKRAAAKQPSRGDASARARGGA